MAHPSNAMDIADINLPFQVVDLRGHSIGMIGFKTEDTFFIADSYLPKSVISKHRIPYTYRPDKALETLEMLLDTHGSIYIPSHGEPSDKPEEDIQSNIDAIERVKNTMINLIKSYMTTEEIVIKTLSKLDVELEQIGLYHLYTSLIKGYISWLEDEGYIEPTLKGEKLLWRAVKK
jgi:glyoxylase-like metal-dependent hydrolase (beta-lactamase superfamily II)